MNNSERPPLDPYHYEQIDAELHSIDETHWPLIAKMRVKNYYPLDVPIPPQQPKHLTYQIGWYAERLFMSEADHYAQFLSDARYPAWLSKLADRVTTRVLNAVDRIEHGESVLGVQISSLGYHGVGQPDMEKDLRKSLWDLTNRYTQKDLELQVRADAVKAEMLNTPKPQVPSVENVSGTGTPVSPRNRERIDEFILRMKNLGLKIKRKDIWRAAGYKDRTEFERFQRGEDRNKSALSNFNRILDLEAEDFCRLMNPRS